MAQSDGRCADNKQESLGGVDAPKSAGCSAEQHGGEQRWQGADVGSLAGSH
jgi:hypothetical protein